MNPQNNRDKKNTRQIDKSKILSGEFAYDGFVHDAEGNVLRPVSYIEENTKDNKNTGETVQVIDDSKIKEGETIFQGKLFSEDGKSKGPIPRIEKTVSEVVQERADAIEKSDGGNFEMTPFDSLMKEVFEKESWLIDSLVPFGGSTALSGSPATFKTWLILDLAIKVATGDPLFEMFKVKQTGVLIVDEESGPRLLQDRIKKLCVKNQLAIYFVSLNNFMLKQGSVKRIIKLAKENDIGLVIFDSLVRIHDADENDAIKMAGVFKLIKELNKNGLTVIFTHHNRKQGIIKSDPSQSMRGSSDILAYVDCHIAVSRDSREESIKVTQTKNRFMLETKPFTLNIESGDNNFSFKYAGESSTETKSVDEEESVIAIIRSLENAGVEEIYEVIKEEIGAVKLRGLLKRLKMNGRINSRQGDHNKEIFFLLENTNQ